LIKQNPETTDLTVDLYRDYSQHRYRLSSIIHLKHSRECLKVSDNYRLFSSDPEGTGRGAFLASLCAIRHFVFRLDFRPVKKPLSLNETFHINTPWASDPQTAQILLRVRD